MQGSISFPSPDWGAGLSARINPATGARYVANIFPETTTETGSALHMRLMKFTDWTSYNSLTEVPLPGGGNLGTNWHTVAMTLRGNEILVSFDGTQIVDFFDSADFFGLSPYTSGAIGAFQFNLGANFDNIGVWPAPPAAQGEWYTVANGQTLSVAAPGVLANDSPANGTNLTAKLVSTTSNGALTLNANGSFTYTPSGGFTGRDTFTYEAVDALTNSSPVTVLIQVSPGGSLFSDDFTRPTDPGQLLPWVIGRGNWTITGGLMQAGTTPDYADVYVPGNWTNLTIQSRLQFPATAEAAGLIARLNPATGARYVANIYPESSTVAKLFVEVMKFTDWTSYSTLGAVPLPVGSLGTNWHTLSMTVQGNEISVQLDGTQVADVVDINSPYTSGGVGLHQYVLGANFDDFIVLPVAPNAVDDSYSIASGGTLSVAAPGVLANDSPGTGTSLIATLLTTTSHGALTLNPDGSFTYTPAPNFTGSDSFTYQAADVATHSSPATVLIEVVPAGSLFFDDFTRATDPAPLSPWVAAHGSWTITSGILQAGSSGSYSDAYMPGNWSNITVQGSIRFPGTGWTAGLSARVNPATGARYVASIFPESTPETGSALHLRLMKFSDWSSYNSLTEVPLPGGNLGNTWHTLAVTLRGNEIIAYLDGVQVVDFLDSSSPYTSGAIGAFQYNLGASFDNIGVWPAPPAAVGEWYPIASGQTLSVAAPGVLANDSPSTGTSLTATLVTTTSHGVLALNPDGSFSYTPSGGFTGRDTFTYEAVDALTNSSPVTVLIQVGPPGSLFADDFTRPTDPGQLLPWVIGRGNWTITGGLMQGDLSPDYSDNCVAGNWANITVQTRLQFPPTAEAAGLNARVNLATGARYVANIYPESSTVAHLFVFVMKFTGWTDYEVLSSVPLPGGNLGTNWHTVSMTVNGNEISVHLDGTQVADVVDSTSPYISGGIGLHQYQLGANFDDVVVWPVVPTSVADSYSMASGATLTVTAPGVLGNDTPGNGTNLTATLLSTASHGSLTLSPDGSFSYTPAGGFIGTDTFTYKANDGFADSAPATVSIAVKPVITVTANNSQRVYGSANPVLSGVITGVQPGDNITASYTTPATSSSPVGPYTITPVLNDPNNKLGNYGGVTFNNGVLSVTQAVLTVTGLSANNKVYDGTTAATISGSPALVGVVGTDQVNPGGTALGTFASRTVGLAKLVNVTGLSLSGANASNYSLTLPVLSANISTATLTVTGLTAANKVYDGTTAATLSGTATLAGVFGTDNVSLGGTASATFATKTAGSTKPVNVTGLSLSGADVANYNLTPPVLSANISTASLSITGLAANNKTYDGTTAATVTGSGTLVGIIGTDQVSLSGTSTATFATRTVSSAKPVNVTGFGLTGADAANYSLTAPVLSANISTATLTITGLTASSKVYDNTTAANLTGTATLAGIIGTDQVGLSGSAIGTFATHTAGAAKPVSVTGQSLTGPDAANYSLTEPVLSANITPASLTVTGITADNKVYDGGTAATIHTGAAVLVGVLGSDNVSLNTAAALATFADSNVGTAKTVTVGGLALAGSDVANYSLVQPMLAANITPAGATVTGITANDKVYDGTTSALLHTNGATLVGVLGTDQVTLVLTNATGTFGTKVVGDGKTVTVSGLILAGPDAAKYTLTQPTTTAAITAATLTVSGLSAQNKVYDSTSAATVTGTPHLVGVIGSDQMSLSGTATGTFASHTAGSAKPINVTGFTLSGADAVNYSLTEPTLSADISTATLTITGLSATSKVYDGTTVATLSGSPTLVGVIGTDQVAVSGTAIATFSTRTTGSAKPVNVTGLDLSGADAGNYALTEPVLSADIGPANLAISGLSAGTKVYDGTTAAALNGIPALMGIIGNDQVTLNGTAVGTFASRIAGSAKLVSVTGLAIIGTDAGNYTLTEPVLNATITPATLTITGLTANNKVYDDTTTATLSGTPILVGTIGADNVSLTGTPIDTFASRTAGSTKPVSLTGLSLTGADAGNYTLNLPMLSANIAPAPLTVTGITADNKVYDGGTAATIHTGAAVLVGVLGSDNVSLNAAAVVGTFDDANVGMTKAVTIGGLLLAGTDAGNYSLVGPILAANITPAGATVSGITANDKIYDGTVAANLNTNSATLAGLLGTDQVTLVLTNATGTFDSKIVGNAKTVTVSGLELVGPDAAKYTLTQPTTTAAVTPASLTINGLSAQDKVYDSTVAATLNGTPQLAGIVGPDQVQLVGTVTGTFATQTAGSAKAVNVTGLTLSGADAPNYNLTALVLSANISTATLTITGLSADNKVYDGTTSDLLSGTPVLVGVIGADQVSLNTSGQAHLNATVIGTFATRIAGSAKPVNVSGLSLTGADAANYSLAQPVLSANITPASLTIIGLSASSKVYDATTAVTLNGTPALAGVLGTDQVSLSGTAIASFATRTAGSAKAVNVTGLSLGGADAVNYSLTALMLNADINPANLNISGLSAGNKTYDSTTAAALNGTPALVGVVGADQVGLGGIIVATFASRTTGSAKPVIVTGLSLIGSDAANYSLTQPSLTANITPATLTVSGITADNKVYDGNTSATIHTGAASLIGVLGSDTVGLDTTAALGTFEDANVGGTKNVSISGLVLAGADSGNYALIQPTVTANITPAGATVTGITASDKIYDGTNTATLNTNSATLAGVLGTDQVTLVLTNAAGTFASKGVGNAKTVTVSGLELVGPDAAKYTLTQPTTTAAITAATLTISGLSAQDKVYDSTGTATLSGAPQLLGVIGTDQVSLSGSAIATFATHNAGPAIPVSVSGLSLTGADAANYTLSEPVLNANISTDTLTISGLSVGNKIYDGTTAATLTGTPALVGILGNDKVSLSGTAIGSFVTRTVGSIKRVNLTGLILAGADAANYTLIQPSLNASITPASLLISGLSANSKIYDGTTAATLSGSPALVGIIGSDQVSFSGTAMGAFATRTTGSAKPVNVTGLGLSGADSANYSLSLPILSANITPASLTVNGITADNKAYDGRTTATIHVGAAVLIGVLGSDNVTLNTAAALGTFVDANVGTTKIVAIAGLTLAGADAANYALTQPTATASITPASATVTGITANNKVYDGTASATLNTNSATLVGVLGTDQVLLVITNASGTFDSKRVGSGKTVTITGLGLVGPDAAKYTLTQPTTTANITAATLTVSGLAAQNKVYDATGAAIVTGTPQLVGVIGSDQVSLSGTATGSFANRATGTAKPINVTGLSLTGADALNYTLTEPVLSANITPANLTVSGLLAGNKVYDGTTATTLSGTPTLVGVLGTDQVSLTGAAAGLFATRTAGAAKPVNVTGLSLTGADAGNYSLTQPSLSANITPAVLTVAADNQNRPYGVSNPSLSFTYSGFVNSENAAVLSGQPNLSTTALASSPAGTYAITVSLGTLSAANYSFQFVNGTLTITPDAPLILGIAKNASSNVVISWTSVSNVTYRVQYSSDLKSSSWSDLAPDITATSSTSSAQDNMAGLTPRFYRIFVVP